MSLYDASALWLLLRDADEQVGELLLADEDPLVMFHTPAEFLNVLHHRSQSSKRAMPVATAAAILDEFFALELDVIPLDDDLLRRSFALRNNLSGYDAFYLAAAARDGLTLVGRDKGHRAIAERLAVDYVAIDRPVT